MKYKDFLMSGNFRIIIGSGDVILLQPTDERIVQLFEQLIRHYFQDNDFVLNNLYGKDRIEYHTLFNDNVLEPFISDLNAFKDKYLCHDYPYPESRRIHWAIKRDFDGDQFFKDFIMSTKFKDLYLEFLETMY